MLTHFFPNPSSCTLTFLPGLPFAPAVISQPSITHILHLLAFAKSRAQVQIPWAEISTQGMKQLEVLVTTSNNSLPRHSRRVTSMSHLPRSS